MMWVGESDGKGSGDVGVGGIELGGEEGEEGDW